MQSFLLFTDQLRYILGYLPLLHILAYGLIPGRERFALRVISSTLFSALSALAYVPLLVHFSDAIAQQPILTAPYWLCMSAIPVAVLMVCYRISVTEALFRTIVASVLESTATVLVRDLCVLTLFPGLPGRNFPTYLLLLFGVYGLVYLFAFWVIRRKLLSGAEPVHDPRRLIALFYLIIYLLFNAIISANREISEHELISLLADPAWHVVYYRVQFLMVFGSLITGVAIGFITLAFHRLLRMQVERRTMEGIMQERQAQYEFSKENIEMINRKSHDLKHQLRALEQVSDEERREQIREARKAIDFYDAVVKTGNEALDTLLTEKSVFCQNRSIRLSCTVNTRQLGRVSVIDLYTLLGNAIDNAIECVEQFQEEERKVISLTIRDQGAMLYIHLENYFTGELRLKDGLPVTSKADWENHGFGVRSMREIARRYGGDMVITAQDGVFSLEVLIPA